MSEYCKNCGSSPEVCKVRGVCRKVDEYSFNDEGIITTPGKFEGEPSFILKLWDMILDGCADESVHDGTMVIDAFKLDKEMAALTGLDEDPDTYVCVWSSDQGFVSHKVMSSSQLFECEGFSVPHDNFEDHPHYESGY